MDRFGVLDRLLARRRGTVRLPGSRVADAIDPDISRLRKADRVAESCDRTMRELAPEVADVVESYRYEKGALVIVVPDAAAHFMLSRRLRGGLDTQLITASTTPIRRIRVTLPRSS